MLKKEDDLDDGWKTIRSKMSDLQNTVKVLQEKMNKLTEKYSNPVAVVYKCTIDDKEESTVEKDKTFINQDYSDVTLACAEDMKISAHEVILSNSNLNGSSVTLVCEDEDKNILAHNIVLGMNILLNKDELQKKEDALLYKRVFLKGLGKNTMPSSSVKEPNKKVGLPMFQFGEGDQCDAEMFLQRPPPSPPYYFPPWPPNYEGSPGHQARTTAARLPQTRWSTLQVKV